MRKFDNAVKILSEITMFQIVLLLGIILIITLGFPKPKLQYGETQHFKVIYNTNNGNMTVLEKSGGMNNETIRLR